MRHDGKVAIVTGASTGIGQASATALHQADSDGQVEAAALQSHALGGAVRVT